MKLFTTLALGLVALTTTTCLAMTPTQPTSPENVGSLQLGKLKDGTTVGMSIDMSTLEAQRKQGVVTFLETILPPTGDYVLAVIKTVNCNTGDMEAHHVALIDTKTGETVDTKDYNPPMTIDVAPNSLGSMELKKACSP